MNRLFAAALTALLTLFCVPAQAQTPTGLQIGVLRGPTTSQPCLYIRSGTICDPFLTVNNSTGTSSLVGSLAAANNLSDLSNVATARTNLGLGTLATQNNPTSLQVTTGLGFTPLNPTNNLSEIASATAARNNLGLGSLATQNTLIGSQITSALGFTPINPTSIGVANGIASLDNSGYVPLAQINPSLTGGLTFVGAWNASTNTPALASSVGTSGQYYIVSVAGSTTLDGVSSWSVGDELVFASGHWTRVPLAAPVQSVATLTGAITATALKGQLAYTPADIFPTGIANTNVASAAAIDAAKLSFTATGTGGTVQTLNTVLNRVVNPDNFGAVGNKVTDDRTAFLNAATAGGPGSVIQLSCTKQYRLSTLDLTSLPGVQIRGCATPDNNNTNPPQATTNSYTNYPGIWLDSTGTITLGNNGGIERTAIIMSSLTWPLANANAYAGDAITAAGQNIMLRDLLVIGFNRPFVSNNFGRHDIRRFYFDTQGPLSITASGDSSIVQYAHAWPFGTVGSGGGTTDWRTGDAFLFSGAQGDTQGSYLLSHGHAVGFHFAGGAATSMYNHLWTEYVGDPIGHPADQYNSSVGFQFDNSTKAMSVDDWYCTTTTVCVKGNLLDQSPSNDIKLGSGIIEGTTSDGIQIQSGNFQIGPVLMEQVGAAALNISSASSYVRMSGVVTGFGTSQPILVPVSCTQDHFDFAALRVARNNNGGASTDGDSLLSRTDCALATITPNNVSGILNLPATGDRFVVGTSPAGLTNLVGANERRRVRLYFTSSYTVFFGSGGQNIQPRAAQGSGASFVMPAASWLEVEWDNAAGFWKETARSPNAWETESTYTPTITCGGGGSISVGSIVTDVHQLGKWVDLEINMSSVTSSCVSYINVTLPINSVSGINYSNAGRGTPSGTVLQVIQSSTPGAIQLVNASNGGPTDSAYQFSLRYRTP